MIAHLKMLAKIRTNIFIGKILFIFGLAYRLRIGCIIIKNDLFQNVYSFLIKLFGENNLLFKFLIVPNECIKENKFVFIISKKN